MTLSKKHGLGEVYRVYAQIKLVEELKDLLHLNIVYEFPKEPISADFPINWVQSDTPNVEGDLMFTWRCFPIVVYQMLNYFKGNYLLFISTNKRNLGYLWQKLFWPIPEVYHTRKSLVAFCHSFDLNIKRTSYYDCPWWPDMSLPFNKHVSVKNDDVSTIYSEWENKLGKYFRAHHVYCLCERIHPR